MAWFLGRITLIIVAVAEEEATTDTIELLIVVGVEKTTATRHPHLGEAGAINKHVILPNRPERGRKAWGVTRVNGGTPPTTTALGITPIIIIHPIKASTCSCLWSPPFIGL